MNNFEAAIVKYVCPICGSVVEDNIIINSRLRKKMLLRYESFIIKL